VAKVDSIAFVLFRWTQDPVLGREVEEGEQRVGLVGDLGDCLGPLRSELGGEDLDGYLAMSTVLGVADVGQGPASRRLGRLRQRIEHIRSDVHPASLFSGLGEHVADGGPKSERAVAHREHRGAHAAPFALPQQIGPRRLRLPVAVGDRHQLLGAVGPHPDDDQAAQAFLVEPHVKVDAVDQM
jgi:hypothetical protein